MGSRKTIRINSESFEPHTYGCHSSVASMSNVLFTVVLCSKTVRFAAATFQARTANIMTKTYINEIALEVSYAEKKSIGNKYDNIIITAQKDYIFRLSLTYRQS